MWHYHHLFLFTLIYIPMFVFQGWCDDPAEPCPAADAKAGTAAVHLPLRGQSSTMIGTENVWSLLLSLLWWSFRDGAMNLLSHVQQQTLRQGLPLSAYGTSLDPLGYPHHGNPPAANPCLPTHWEVPRMGPLLWQNQQPPAAPQHVVQGTIPCQPCLLFVGIFFFLGSGFAPSVLLFLSLL